MKNVLMMAGIALLAACSGSWETNYEKAVDPTMSTSWHVHDIVVQIPDDLTTTESNTFTPNADVVWHGDPFGDRKAQAAAILETGIRQGTANLRGPRGVDFVITMREFHAMTPRAQAQAPSGVHNISYDFQVFDDLTGEPITAPEMIRADLLAFTGTQAVENAIQGNTQKVRITRHLKVVTEGWLGIGPDPRQQFTTAGR